MYRTVMLAIVAAFFSFGEASAMSRICSSPAFASVVGKIKAEHGGAALARDLLTQAFGAPASETSAGETLSMKYAFNNELVTIKIISAASNVGSIRLRCLATVWTQ
jgi:hypothetical protein